MFEQSLFVTPTTVEIQLTSSMQCSHPRGNRITIANINTITNTVAIISSTCVLVEAVLHSIQYQLISSVETDFDTHITLLMVFMLLVLWLLR